MEAKAVVALPKEVFSILDLCISLPLVFWDSSQNQMFQFFGDWQLIYHVFVEYLTSNYCHFWEVFGAMYFAILIWKTQV